MSRLTFGRVALVYAVGMAAAAGCGAGGDGAAGTEGTSTLASSSSSRRRPHGSGGAGAPMGTGGGTGTGGTTSTGGAIGTGGAVGTGGAIATGGATGAGGVIATGGVTGTGGAIGTAGSGAGGSTSASGGAGTNTGGAGGGGTGGLVVGNPNGHCAVPAAAQAVDVSSPTTTVGTGTAASCTAAAVVAAVHAGGVVTFRCGPDPLTIPVPEIDIFNDGGQAQDGSVTLDGGGKITLSADGDHRILYQNTCDGSLHFTSPRCDIQTTPHLVVQNIAFANGKATAGSNNTNGGGAIYVGGGTFKAVNIRISSSAEVTPGQDFGGGAIYAFEQTQPVTIVNSTFDGNSGANGGAISGLFSPVTILNSVFSGNQAVGHGENPARPGTTGGGLGGAIYVDGNDFTLSLCGTLFDTNLANELGSGAIFQVVDDLNGDLVIDQSTLHANSNVGSVQSHPGIYVEARDKAGNAGVSITNSTFN